MLRSLVLLACFAGCGHHGDENLGLSTGAEVAIDVAKLTQPEELVRALSMSGRELDQRLGAHRMDANSSLKLTLPGQTPQSLDESFMVETDGLGAVHVMHDNSRGNGFEAVSQTDDFYVRPRHGKFVRRKAEGDELARLRTTAETAAAADLRLLQRFVYVHRAGTASVAGHAGVRLSLSARASPERATADNEPGRKWRESVSVRYIDGDVVLDARSGAPLAVRLDASYAFLRDGKTLQAALSYKQTTSTGPSAIASPAEWTTLSRPRPMLDRQTLLDGLK
jgi:hypothetical protein